MGSCKTCAVIGLQVAIILGVYSLTFWKYYESLGKPGWADWPPMMAIVVIVSIFGGIILFAVIKYTCYHCCFDIDTSWRPSVIVYLLFCAWPCNGMLLYSHLEKENTSRQDLAHLLGVFQAIVAGLLFTEWIAKFRMERLTYTLVEDAAIDFFFAYDVFDFYDRYFEKEATKNSSAWLVVTVIFASLAMLKYFPRRPLDMEDRSSHEAAVRYILFGMICNDICFVLIRVFSMISYGLEVVDVIHPLKNFFLIIFASLQLWLLNENNSCRGGDCIRRHERYELLHSL